MTLSLADRCSKTQKIRILPMAGRDPESHRNEMIKVTLSHSLSICCVLLSSAWPENNFVTTEITKGVTVGQLLSSIMPGTWRQKLTCLHNEVTKGQWNVNMSASVTLAWWVCVTPNEKCWQQFTVSLRSANTWAGVTVPELRSFNLETQIFPTPTFFKIHAYNFWRGIEDTSSLIGSAGSVYL